MKRITSVALLLALSMMLTRFDTVYAAGADFAGQRFAQRRNPNVNLRSASNKVSFLPKIVAKPNVVRQGSNLECRSDDTQSKIYVFGSISKSYYAGLQARSLHPQIAVDAKPKVTFDADRAPARPTLVAKVKTGPQPPPFGLLATFGFRCKKAGVVGNVKIEGKIGIVSRTPI